MDRQGEGGAGEGLGSNEELSERCTGGSMHLIWEVWGRMDRQGEGGAVREWIPPLLPAARAPGLSG